MHLSVRRVLSWSALACAAALAACNSSSSSPTVTTPTPTPSASVSPSTAPSLTPVQGLQSKINHIIVISQENWSFDSLFGKYPGANGYSNAISATQQVDLNGNVITTLPQPLIGGKPDPRFPANLPAAPFDLSNYVPPDSTQYTGDPNHNFYIQQYEIDGTPITSGQPGANGKMDRYLAQAPNTAVGTQGGLPMGYYDATNFPEGKIAQQYALLDNLSQSAFGGSFLNNMYLWCACTPVYPVAQAQAAGIAVEQYDASGNPVQLGGPEGRLTGDGYAVNTMFPANWPQISGYSSNLLIPQTLPNIGDRLTAAGVNWKWYAGGLNNAIAGKPDPTFQAHHQSPLFFQNYAPGTPGSQHVQDLSQFFTDLASNNLPNVVFIKNLGEYNEHPGYANVINGQLQTVYLLNQIQMSQAWKDALILVYYDEAGGHYDHVAPQPTDRWGPSTRVPAYVISPFARKGYVDHTKYEVVSFLSTIEQKYNLQPLGTRDANANPLLGMLDFSLPTPAAYAKRPLGMMPAPVAVPPPSSIPPPFSKTGHYPVTELDD